MKASRLATFRSPPNGGEFGVTSACFHTHRSTVFLCFGRLVQGVFTSVVHSFFIFTVFMSLDFVFDVMVGEVNGCVSIYIMCLTRVFFILVLLFRI
jgi:hypothetical protein